MKKKISACLIILSLCFIAGGFYIIGSIDGVSSRLENIITLQQVEIMRENLLAHIKVVQADLLLKDSPYARNIDDFMQHVEKMDQLADSCTDCHHTESVDKELKHLRDEVDLYQKKLSRVYTIRADRARLNEEKLAALQKGKQIIAEVNTIVVSSSEKLAHRIEQAGNDITNTRKLLVTLVSLGPVVVLFIAFFFFKHFAGSVAALIGATRGIRDGNLQYRIEENLKDEFQELAAAFNEMSGSLKEQCVKMQHTERLAVVGELAAGLAHEVRNPLGGIKVTLEILLQDKVSLDQEEKELLWGSVNEIMRIEELLQSLLNYARPPEPRFGLLDINKLVDASIKTVRYSSKKKNIQFAKKLSDQLPQVAADSSQLKQVFLNLLINAVDAIAETGTITVKTSVEQEAGVVKIEISDNGEGLAGKDLDKIFLPFFTTKAKGTGLGLAVCKRLIDQHGGAINVAGNPEGGVRFTVSLPVKQGAYLQAR